MVVYILTNKETNLGSVEAKTAAKPFFMTKKTSGYKITKYWTGYEQLISFLRVF